MINCSRSAQNVTFMLPNRCVWGLCYHYQFLTVFVADRPFLNDLLQLYFDAVMNLVKVNKYFVDE